MEVFTTFVVILIAGMALPIVLFISAVVFDLVVVLYVLVETMVSRKRKPRTSGAVAGYTGIRKIGWAG
jgi:hypothetical protein